MIGADEIEVVAKPTNFEKPTRWQSWFLWMGWAFNHKSLFCGVTSNGEIAVNLRGASEKEAMCSTVLTAVLDIEAAEKLRDHLDASISESKGTLAQRRAKGFLRSVPL